MNLKSIREQQDDLEVKSCEDTNTDWMEEFSKLREEMLKKFEERTIKSGYKFNGIGHYINDSRGRRYV